MEKQEFDKKFNALDEVDRELLQIMALTYEPNTITELQKCISECGFLKGLKQKEESRAIRKFEGHFLDKVGNSLSVNRDIINFIVKEHCLKNPALNFYSRVQGNDSSSTSGRHTCIVKATDLSGSR